MRISDWSSDVCSSDLSAKAVEPSLAALDLVPGHGDPPPPALDPWLDPVQPQCAGQQIPEGVAQHRARRARPGHARQRQFALTRLPPCKRHDDLRWNQRNDGLGEHPEPDAQLTRILDGAETPFSCTAKKPSLP